MSTLTRYQKQFAPQYSNFPHGRYATLFLLRQVESEAIFRTEGSGEPLNREFVHAGQSAQQNVIQRAVISKRKQTAVERRAGRELLRINDLLYTAEKAKEVCALNRNNPCGKCIDCMTYGYAVGGGGAQKSRVVTDDAFSLHSATDVIGTRQFNALYDNSTMRDPFDGKASTSIGTDEYIKPETIFLDIETLKDVTLEEFQYVLGNIMRSTRYGAVSSRVGKMSNHLVGVVFSNCELFSNLEWTQATYDKLANDSGELTFPLHTTAVTHAARATMESLLPKVMSPVTTLAATEIDALLQEMNALYSDEAALKTLLTNINEMYTKKG